MKTPLKKKKFLRRCFGLTGDSSFYSVLHEGFDDVTSLPMVVFKVEKTGLILVTSSEAFQREYIWSEQFLFEKEVMKRYKRLDELSQIEERGEDLYLSELEQRREAREWLRNAKAPE